MNVRVSLSVAAFALAATPAFATDGRECLDIGTAHDTAYMMFDGRSHNACGEVVGSVAEKKIQIWFRLDDAEWIVQDPAMVHEAGRLFAKVNEIGGRQGKIGAQQGLIGAEQGRIGAKQAQLAIRNLGQVGAERESAAEAAARSARMRELGDQMAVLGRQQAALGEELKREIAAAQQGLSQLLARAIKDDKAARIRHL